MDVERGKEIMIERGMEERKGSEGGWDGRNERGKWEGGNEEKLVRGGGKEQGRMERGNAK